MELTGRENVFLNGSFLGMNQDEIWRKFETIVKFSEIEQFIDTPVKYYSSGMFVRLAFSVAAHLTPEVLLLDEVLSVGDVGFQEKSKQKMKELINSGATIVFVSHNENLVKEVCRRALFLENGVLKMDDDVSKVVDHYLNSFK
jgi:lipopolysaccharide transport system ATP-binding protein